MLVGKKAIGTLSYLGGVPCVLESFCWSWGQLLQHSTDVLCTELQYIHSDKATFSDHGPARNSLVDRMLGDWLLMLDTDHSFDPDLLVRMLHRMDEIKADVMVGLYTFKNPPHAPVLFVRDGDSKTTKLVVNWNKEATIIKVSSAGAGCLLVKREVFRRIRKELKQGPFDRIEGLSEDHSFFWRLHQLEIPVWCDVRIECNHLQVKPIGIADYDNSLETSEPIPVQGYGAA